MELIEERGKKAHQHKDIPRGFVEPAYQVILRLTLYASTIAPNLIISEYV